MENLSHSRHPLPKKTYNGSSGYGKAAATRYDDVFAGPPRFGAPTLSPRLEDYCEIFGGFNGSARIVVSSIPVLDLPLVDDGDVYFDVRSPGFDYREVFGGFEDLDLAPSYEELLMDRSEGGDGDSSDEAWTPVETDSVSGGREHSGKSACFSDGRDSYESIDGSTEFNISYNKAGGRSGAKMSSGMTHPAEQGPLHSYNFTVDEMACTGRRTKEKHIKKTQSLARSNTGNDDGSRKHYIRTGSFPSETFVTVSDISLKTQPSELPPPSRPPPSLRRDSSSSASNYRTTGSESSVGGNSPPFFDVEVDASSAAVKEAMEKAQAKLKSAKEILERKRDGVRTSDKSGSNNDRITRERKLNNKEAKLSVFSPEIEKNTDVSRKSSADEQGKKSLPFHGYSRLDGNGEWKEATQFFELSRTEMPGNIGENSKAKNISLRQISEFHDQEQKEKRGAKGGLEKQERKAKGDGTSPEGEKSLKDLETTKAVHKHNLHEERMGKNVLQDGMGEKSRNVVLHIEAEKKVLNHSGLEKHENLVTSEQGNWPLVDKSGKLKREFRCKENNKGVGNPEQLRKPHPLKAVQKKQEDVFDWEENARKLREALGLADNESSFEVSLEPREDGKAMKMVGGMDDNEKKLKEALERIENESRMKVACEKENDMGLREAIEKAENERRWKEALEQEEKNRRVGEACEKEENKRRMREALEKADNEKRMKEQEEMEQQIGEACEKEEKRRSRETHEKAGHEWELKIALEQEEKERRIKEAGEREENEQRISQAHEKAEFERKQKETLEQGEKERKIKEFHEALERAENERRLKEALEQEERERQEKEAREKEENERKLKEAIEQEERERKLTEAVERAESERRLKEVIKHEEMEMRQIKAQEREESEDHEHQVNERQDECMREGNEKKPEEALENEGIDEIQGEAREREKIDKSPDGKQWLEESLTEALEEDEFDKEDDRETVGGDLKEENEAGEMETRSKSDNTSPWKDFEKKLKAACIEEGFEGLDAECGLFERKGEFKELGSDGGDYDLKGELDEVSKPGAENIREDVVAGRFKTKGERFENSNKAFASEENVETGAGVKDKEKRSGRAVMEGVSLEKTAEDSVDCMQRNSGESKSASNKFTRQQEEMGCVLETQASLNQDVKLEKPLLPRGVKDSVDSAKKVAVPNSVSQTAGNKSRNLEEVSKQREKEAERIKRERELEMERLRKIEEEREREREREKDRMAFDQKALADARERLEKACSQAKEKCLADKLSAEVRLRAERAAVERATVEARERAAEKAALEARERAERSVPGKQFQSSASFGASRYHISSANAGADGESPQRYISRLERHRRTAERVAKALAEKNMRDLVAQREQAERNRLAENLDAEVKRWSSGKEGNIRALLSTLQYILGPESSWQPIPLTEVITSAAVKKAYRKATLCVHPDKLQQRGASVQQKYICEKVFDLLKEAWNRFNSEER